MPKLQLPSVTLIALTNRNFDDHKKALDICCEHIDFGAAKIVYDKDISSVDTWCKKVVYDLWKYVDTEHAFLFHSDGYITHPELWDPAWLSLDYIGAPFPLPQDNFSYRDFYGNVQRVGNSVGLRSRKLMKLPSDINMEWKPFHGYWHEDGFISVNMRHVFEENGCKFGTFDQALDFGKEHELPEHNGRDTFCFHSDI